MNDQEIADIIATAVLTNDITSMSLDQLDQLAELKYADDDTVSFSDLDFAPDAGADLHGVNTEEEMFITGGKNA